MILVGSFFGIMPQISSKSIESRSDQMSILAEYIDQELRDQNIIKEIN